MTVLPPLLFSCFQAFFAAPSRLIPLSRPPFVTNLLHQPVSDLFQFYATFPLPSRLISFSVIFSLPCCLIPFFAAFSLLSCLILGFLSLLSVPLQYFQCIFSSVIILSVSPAYTKSIYIITKCYFECRFGSDLYSPAVKYLFFYLSLGQRQ